MLVTKNGLFARFRKFIEVDTMADIFEIFKKISTGADNVTTPPEYIIVGLGNPGDKYTFTRHNAGFLALDLIAQKCNCSVKQLKFKSLCGDTVIDGHRVLLMKPQTYMNNSGEAIIAASSFYKIPPEKILVLVDDIYQAPGRMRIRKNGSAGGHNGLKSIIAHLSSEDFTRIRIGVGEKPNKEYELAAWVTGQIPEADREPIFKILTASYEACTLLLNGKLDEAMGRFNGLNYGTEGK